MWYTFCNVIEKVFNRTSVTNGLFETNKNFYLTVIVSYAPILYCFKMLSFACKLTFGAMYIVALRRAVKRSIKHQQLCHTQNTLQLIATMT